jgi:DnaK suppressor protein
MTSTMNLNLDLYKAALLKRAAECRNDLEDVRKDVAIENTAEVMEQGIRAADREVAMERMETAYRQLRQVESALSRMERDEYGICLKCEDDIGQKRLDALPWAVLCVECQETAERLRGSGAALRRAA